MCIVRKRFNIGESSSLDCYIYIIRRENQPDEFWFKGKEIATFLEYKKPSDAISDNVYNEWRREWQHLKISGNIGHHDDVYTSGSLKVCNLDDAITCASNSLDDVIPDDVNVISDDVAPSNWQPHTVFISEPGLYELVTRSKKPEAVQFTKWVYETVLPELRRTGQYAIASNNKDEPIDTSDVVVSIKKDMEIQKLNYELQLQQSESRRRECQFQIEQKETETTMLIKLKNAELREAQLQYEKEHLGLHYRYMFQTDSAHQMGKLAIEQYIQRQALEKNLKAIKSLVNDRYKLIRNMDDTLPMKTNYIGIVYNETDDRYKIIRQQWGTARRSYDYIVKSSNAKLELLDPSIIKQRLKKDWIVMGDMIKVSHGVNVWTQFLRTHLEAAYKFGMLFSDWSFNSFSLLSDDQLRAHYRIFKNQQKDTYCSKLFNFYNTLYRNLAFVDEEDCVKRCFIPDIWTLREMLMKFIACNNIDYLEQSSCSVDDDNISLDSSVFNLIASSINDEDANAIQHMAEQFPQEAETLKILKTFEVQKLMASNPNALNQALYQLAIPNDDDSDSHRHREEEYLIEMPNTPQRSNDGESVVLPSQIRRYLNDLTTKRQSNVEK